MFGIGYLREKTSHSKKATSPDSDRIGSPPFADDDLSIDNQADHSNYARTRLKTWSPDTIAQFTSLLDLTEKNVIHGETEDFLLLDSAATRSKD